MPQVKITVPEHLEMQIAQMVEEGEFLNREEAVEELLSTGIKAYKTSGPRDDDDSNGFEDEGMMGHEDEYVFLPLALLGRGPRGCGTVRTALNNP